MSSYWMSKIDVRTQGMRKTEDADQGAGAGAKTESGLCMLERVMNRYLLGIGWDGIGRDGHVGGSGLGRMGPRCENAE